MTVHTLKCLATYFDDVLEGKKCFECRKDDRGFQVGDKLLLNEVIRDGLRVIPTERQLMATVSYKLDDFEGLRDGYCILGLADVAGIVDARYL
jgi:hypothetical protein